MSEQHVIFGTGPIGLAVMEALSKRGKSIRMVNRSGKADVPKRVEVIAGDATDPAFTREAVTGASVVYNCTNPPYNQWPELFPKLQAGVVAGVRVVGAKLVVMDNLYMYGSTNGRPMTEDTPMQAQTRKGRTRTQMAQDLLDAHQRGDIQVAIGRASDYFGPRGMDTALGDRVIYPILVGKAAQLLGNPDLPHTYSYIPDIGEGLAILGERDEALGQVWHLPNAPTLTTRQVVEMIFAEAGHPPKISVAPRWGVWLFGLFNPVVREVYEMLYEFEEPFIVDHSKFERAFGNHTTPLEAAIKATVGWFRANPKH